MTGYSGSMKLKSSWTSAILGDDCEPHFEHKDTRHPPPKPKRLVLHREHPRVREDPFKKIKLAISFFDGNDGPDAYIDWELAVDKQFAGFDFHETHKIKIAASKFIASALSWWDGIIRKGKLPHNWRDMKQLMRAKFVPSNHALGLQVKLLRLKQGKQTVNEYYKVYHEIQCRILHCGVEENEKHCMSRFFCGLDSEIQYMIAHRKYNSLSCLLNLACEAERKMKGRQTTSVQASTKLVAPPIVPLRRAILKSTSCGEKEHKSVTSTLINGGDPKVYDNSAILHSFKSSKGTDLNA
jgi:hypothetical protein